MPDAVEESTYDRLDALDRPDLGDDSASQLRMQPAGSLLADGEVGWREGLRHCEAKHDPVDGRAERLHQVEDQCRPVGAHFVQEAGGGVEAYPGGLNVDVALHHRVSRPLLMPPIPTATYRGSAAGKKVTGACPDRRVP